MLTPLVHASTYFAVDLYRQLATEHSGDNLFFSPHSVFSALVMTIEGARGETAQQMGTVLHLPVAVHWNAASGDDLPWPTAALHPDMAALQRSLASEVEPEQLHATREKIQQLEQEYQTLAQQLNQLQSEQEQFHTAPVEAVESQRLAAVFQERLAVSQQVMALVRELQTLRDQVDPYELRIANALWGEQTVAFHPSFVDTLRSAYGAAVHVVDFRRQPEAARAHINDWIAQQTRERLREFLARGTVSPATRLVLANGIFLRSSWAQPFTPQLTQEADFTLHDGTTTRATFMAALQQTAPYAELRPDGTRNEQVFDPQRFASQLSPNPDGVQLLALPYRGHRMTMLLVLPQRPDGLPGLERQLSPQTVERWLVALQPERVQVFVPRFTLAATYQLPSTLAALGMPTAFRPGGFLGMSAAAEARDLCLSNIVHGAFVEVAEEGTQAGAVTVVVAMVPVSKVRRPPPPIFRADHPFLFCIRDNQTGAILFMGRVFRP